MVSDSTDKDRVPDDALAANLGELLNNFEEEIGRPPSSKEVCELIEWALGSLPPGTTVDEVRSVLAEPRKGVDTRASDAGDDGSQVDELNDAVFVNAIDLVTGAAEFVRREVGSAPRAEQVASLVLELLHASDRTLSDVMATDLGRLKVRAVTPRRRHPAPKIGDVVAIPTGSDTYNLASVITKNAFGTALGLFEGHGPLRPYPASTPPEPLPRPVYTSDGAITSGRWRIVGHDERLLAKFPAEPEIYHRQHATAPNSAIGPYGSGETAGGAMRELSREEAEEIGLLDRSYDQVLTPDELEEQLRSKPQR